LGIKLLLQVVGFKVILISFVPFSALFPVPLFLTPGIATSLLAIFEPRMGPKPPPANAAWTLFGVSLCTHGFTSLLGYDNTIQTNWGEYTTIHRDSDLSRYDMFISDAKTEKNDDMIKESEE